MTRWAVRYKKEAGFSLTELVIILACAAIMAALAAPSISHLQREWALWGCAHSVENSLQWGRMAAISANTSMLFEVGDNGHRFGWIDPESGDPYADSVRFLAPGIRIVSSPKHPLRFYPHGNAVPAGTYVLEGETGSYSVVVSPGGRIRFQKN
jgi:type II secretory pathway pseudopilin PulG